MGLRKLFQNVHKSVINLQAKQTYKKIANVFLFSKAFSKNFKASRQKLKEMGVESVTDTLGGGCGCGVVGCVLVDNNHGAFIFHRNRVNIVYKLFRYEHENSIIHLDHRLVIKLNEWIDVKRVDDV